jgi:hypothetical protein
MNSTQSKDQFALTFLVPMLLGLEGTPGEHPALHLLRVDSPPDAAWRLLVILELLALMEGGSPILEVGAKAFQGQVIWRGG